MQLDKSIFKELIKSINSLDFSIKSQGRLKSLYYSPKYKDLFYRRELFCYMM